MNTKLTLSVDDDIIHQAKQYAKLRRVSLSKLIGNYLKSLSSNNKKHNVRRQLSLEVRNLKGAVKIDNASFDYKKELHKALEKKYL